MATPAYRVAGPFAKAPRRRGRGGARRWPAVRACRSALLRVRLCRGEGVPRGRGVRLPVLLPCPACVGAALPWCMGLACLCALWCVHCVRLIN